MVYITEGDNGKKCVIHGFLFLTYYHPVIIPIPEQGGNQDTV